MARKSLPLKHGPGMAVRDEVLKRLVERKCHDRNYTAKDMAYSHEEDARRIQQPGVPHYRDPGYSISWKPLKHIRVSGPRIMHFSRAPLAAYKLHDS